MDDTTWARMHLMGTNYQDEDCVPGSGAAAAIIDLVNATILDRYYTGCNLNLVGGM